MSFGETLRELLNRSDIKMYNLADALGYDKSYISKWINSAKLPPAKDISVLSEKIGNFINRSCSDAHREILCNYFDLSADSLSDDIAQLLHRAYLDDKYTDAPKQMKKTSAAVSKRSVVRECVIATQPLEYLPVDDDLQSLELGSGRSRLSAIIDSHGFDSDVDSYWRYISRLMALGSNVDVSLIEVTKDSKTKLPSRLVISKDEFVSRSTELPFSNDIIMTRSEDSAVVDAYYQDARRFLMRQQSMLESSNVNGNLYYYKYAGSDQKRYLLSGMFPLYMSTKLFAELLNKYGTALQRSEKARSRYLREFTTPKSVVIYDSAFLRYMSTGKISAFDATEHETLTKTERKRHLTELIEEIEEGRLSLRVLSDKNPILNYDDTTLSFFMNSNSAYYSNLMRKKEGVQYFISSANRRRLSEFLDHIDSLDESYLTSNKLTIDYIYNGIKNI